MTDNDPLALSIIKRYNIMESKRATWDSIWEDVRHLVDPSARNITTGGYSQEDTPDRYDIARLVDTTLCQSVQITANGQLSHVTPVGEQWFAFDTPAHVRDETFAAWCSEATEIAQREIARSNFYDVVHEDYLTRTAYGIGCLFSTWSDKLGTLLFKEIPVGTYCVEEDDEGRVDTVFRRFYLTPRQAIMHFDKDMLPAQIIRDADHPAKQDNPVPFLHAVYPNLERDPAKDDNKNMPWRSVYVSEQHKKVVRESGFDSLPFHVSRWIRWGETPYGIGAGVLAMPAAKQANFLEVMADYVAEKATNPPILVPAGFKHDIDSTPGGITHFDPTGKDNMPQEWQTGSAYQIDKDRLADKRTVIEAICFVPLFRSITEQTKAMTAREVQERVSEQLTMFHPVFARLTVEMLTPMLKRVLSLLIEHEVIPPPPSSVMRRSEQNAALAEIPDPGVQYSSRIALALKEQQSTGFYSMLELIGQLGNVAPDVLNIPNFAKAFRDIARSRCIPEAWMRSEKEIEDRLAQQQQAAAAQQMPDAAQKYSQAVKNVGGADQAAELMAQLQQQ